MKLGSLISSGKDSMYAMYLMKQKGNSIECFITIKSKNKDSYMLHTPAIEMTKLQAEAMGVPLLEHSTEGEKEKELKDIKEALQKAKDQYNIEGITTGALYSQYQKERIEKMCEELSLECFSPLWHMDQEKEVREIIDNQFEFILTKIAGEGFDKSWLGKVIIHKDVDKLVDINKKIGINIAFEGGEAESLVIDCPMFNKKIEIVDFEIEEENDHIAIMDIKEARLVEK